MEDYNDLLSDNSADEEAYYSDRVDSDIEAELYGLIHHDTQDNSISLQDKSDSVEIKSVSLHDKSGSAENNSILPQNSLSSTDDNSVLPLTDSVAPADTVNTTKNRKSSLKKNNQNYSTPVTTNHTNFFSSDTIVNNNLYYSFESPIRKQKMQRNRAQSENSKINAIPTSSKRKSDVVSEILGNIQSKKNLKSMQPENRVSKQKNNNPGHSSKMTKAESFVEVVDDSSDSDSSIISLDPDQSNLQTNITKETVILSSDSEDSDSSMEKSFSQACRSKETEIAKADVGPDNKDLWLINSEDKFRTKKQSNRYHDNAVVTCSKCQLKGHSAKFCTVPKAVKCFFCGDCHSGMNCRNKICTKCFQQGHDRRRCYIRFIDTCELCRMRGHSERNCPDLWRRYHLTTSKGSIVKGNLNPHSPLFCYSCGSKGHYGAECLESRIDRWSFPTWTSVISYKNPISVLRRENKRNFGQEERNFGPKERNFGPKDRNFQQEIRNFRQEERNFQQEERNFHERSRFNRTPLFQRRKGNETFSNSTPTQNTKKKKKKSKTPPNSNQQSTPRVTNIVQNEVYFPRTPKMTPSSSTERFPKKKSKKLKNKGDRFSRQQVMHQIGLQQRLGLPFPSTV